MTIPRSVEADLMSLFGKFGVLDSVIAYATRNYAFVNIKRLDDAKKAKEALQGSVIRGSAIRIEFSRPNESSVAAAGAVGFGGCGGFSGRNRTMRQLGFLRARTSSGVFSWSDSRSEARHDWHLAISRLKQTAGEQTDFAGERKEVAGGRYDIMNSPLAIPNKHPLPWNSKKFLPAEKNKTGEELSHFCRLLDPPFRRTCGGGFPGPRRSVCPASCYGARLEEVDFGGGPPIGDRLTDHPPRYLPKRSKKIATRQGRGSTRRTKRGHRRASRQRAQAALVPVSKMESSANSRVALVTAVDRPARSYTQVAAHIPEGIQNDTSVEGTIQEAQRRHPGFSLAPHCLPKTGRGERCFRCLAKDHMVKDCREPIKCLECGQLGHRRTSCPQRSPQPKTGAVHHSATGLFACLVGEVSGSIPMSYSTRAGDPRLQPSSLGGYIPSEFVSN